MDTIKTIAWDMLARQAAPMLMLFAAGLLALFVGIRRPRVPLWIGGAAVLTALWWIGLQWSDNVVIMPQAMLTFDALSMIGTFLGLSALLGTLLLSRHYLMVRNLPTGEYVALLCFGMLGFWSMISTTHLLMIFVGLETLSIASYVLAAYHRTDEASIEAGLKYFVLGSLAAAFLLFGMAFLFGGTGSLDLAQIATINLHAVGEGQRLMTLVGVGLVLTGVLFKLAAVPFQFWTPDVYGGAPLPITAFFATGVKTGAFIVLLRVLDGVGGYAPAALGSFFWWVAIVTIVVGNVTALRQNDIKRMLAYSSIAHAGYALAGFALVREGLVPLPGILFYLMTYTLMTVGALGVLVALSPSTTERTALSDLAGLGRTRPVLALVLTICLLSLAGFPPTAGFFAKYYLFQAIVASGEVKLAIFAMLGSVVGVAYYVRPIVTMYFDDAPNAVPPPLALTRGVRWVLLGAACGLLVLGVYPSPVLQLLTGQ